MSLNLLRGAFEEKFRKVMNFEGTQDLLNLLYKGNSNEVVDFSFYDEENDRTFFATYEPANKEKNLKRYIIIATFSGFFSGEEDDTIFDENRLSEIVLVPGRAYLTTKYPSNEANIIAINDAYKMEQTWSVFSS